MTELPTPIKELIEVLSENSINLSIDKNVEAKGDKILYIDLGEDPIDVDGDLVSFFKSTFNGEEARIKTYENVRVVKIILDRGEKDGSDTEDTD